MNCGFQEPFSRGVSGKSDNVVYSHKVFITIQKSKGNFMNKKRNVTFIGLGTMGYPMAGHLSKSSLVNLRVFNRTMGKALKWNKELKVKLLLH